MGVSWFEIAIIFLTLVWLLLPLLELRAVLPHVKRVQADSNPWCLHTPESEAGLSRTGPPRGLAPRSRSCIHTRWLQALGPHPGNLGGFADAAKYLYCSQLSRANSESLPATSVPEPPNSS